MSVKIIQGDDAEFNVVVKLDGSIYDLTSVAAATFKIPLAAGGCLDLTLGAGVTIPTPTNGTLAITVSDTESPTLKLGKLNVELVLEESGKIKTLQFKNGVEIIARYC